MDILKRVSIVAGLLLVIGGWVFSLGVQHSTISTLSQSGEELGQRIDDIERVREEDHDLLIQVSQDVKWIKQRLDRMD